MALEPIGPSLFAPKVARTAATISAVTGSLAWIRVWMSTRTGLVHVSQKRNPPKTNSFCSPPKFEQEKLPFLFLNEKRYPQKIHSLFLNLPYTKKQRYPQKAEEIGTFCASRRRVRRWSVPPPRKLNWTTWMRRRG